LWGAAARGDTLTFDGRLRLLRPTGDSRGWTVTGRFRVHAGWRSIPVVLELWPVHDILTGMTMTPHARVFASQGYFRVGNATLDRLTADLVRRAGAAPGHVGHIGQVGHVGH
ncbi:MAG: hypothetical protein ACHQNA_13405, partial [Acidimicrobiales bacterium]